MKYKYPLLIIPLLTMSIPHVQAETCDTADIERLTTIANHVDLSYSIELSERDSTYDNDTYFYKFNLSNLTAELYAKTEGEYGEYIYNYQNNKDGIVSAYNLTGGTYKIDVYSTTCNKKLRTITITLPYYNHYYNTETCKNINDENLMVCIEWTKAYIDNNTFEKGIEEYNQKKEDIPKEKEINKWLNFLKNNYIYIAAGLILLIIIITIIVNKKRGELK